MFLLDSNAWIALFRGKSVSLLGELKQRPATDIVLCPVVLTELQYGVCRSPVEYRATNHRLVDELLAEGRGCGHFAADGLPSWRSGLHTGCDCREGHGSDGSIEDQTAAHCGHSGVG